jgi:hypothetical protein
MSLIGDKSSIWILWLPSGGRKSGVGAKSGVGTSAAGDRGDPGTGTGSVQWTAAGGAGCARRGRVPARKETGAASVGLWATLGCKCKWGREAGWATWEWGRQKRLAGSGSASS